ncbi:MAG: chorismate mutase [Candidatus Gastranaerophilales bacterium]|nr:chorismate mutase [Candidatus Gastranaerophilales bacterium]
MIRAIRGAITIENDTAEEVKNATVELIDEIIKRNNLKTEDFAFAQFSITKDIKSATPAKFARLNAGWHNVPMMCYNEFEFDGSLEKCIRILIVTNSEKEQTEMKHVYLKNAEKLRPDLKNK